jgi:hypothetical protein
MNEPIPTFASVPVGYSHKDATHGCSMTNEDARFCKPGITGHETGHGGAVVPLAGAPSRRHLRGTGPRMFAALAQAGETCVW